MNASYKRRMAAVFRSSGRKRAYNLRLFAVVAPRYNLVTRLLSFGRDAQWKHWLVNQLPEQKDAPVCLDLACGTGDVSFLLEHQFPSGRTLGIDLSPDMLRIASRHAGHNGVTFLRGDLLRLPVATGRADVVTACYALRNAPNLEQCLAEIRRVLHRGGKLVILDFARADRTWIARAQVLLLTAWGAFWGAVLHRDPRVYRYIAESLRAFPARREFKAKLRAHGFKPCLHRSFFFGMADGLICECPSP